MQLLIKCGSHLSVATNSVFTVIEVFGSSPTLNKVVHLHVQQKFSKVLCVLSLCLFHNATIVTSVKCPTSVLPSTSSVCYSFIILPCLLLFRLMKNIIHFSKKKKNVVIED